MNTDKHGWERSAGGPSPAAFRQSDDWNKFERAQSLSRAADAVPSALRRRNCSGAHGVTRLTSVIRVHPCPSVVSIFLL